MSASYVNITIELDGEYLTGFKAGYVPRKGDLIKPGNLELYEIKDVIWSHSLDASPSVVLCVESNNQGIVGE